MSSSIIDAVSPRTYVPQDPLYVWALVNPAAPTLVGAVGLSQLVADCATFTYTPDWWNFALSEDLPLLQAHAFSTGEKSTAPGAIDDARPDRWGERIIRHIDRPARLSILEMLLFAGDDRFGRGWAGLVCARRIPTVAERGHTARGVACATPISSPDSGG